MDEKHKTDTNGDMPRKKKTRRGNKGRPKIKKDIENGSVERYNLLQAVRQVVMSHEDLIETAICPAQASTSSNMHTDSEKSSNNELPQIVLEEFSQIHCVDHKPLWTVTELGNDLVYNKEKQSSSCKQPLQHTEVDGLVIETDDIHETITTVPIKSKYENAVSETIQNKRDIIDNDLILTEKLDNVIELIPEKPNSSGDSEFFTTVNVLIDAVSAMTMSSPKRRTRRKKKTNTDKEPSVDPGGTLSQCVSQPAEKLQVEPTAEPSEQLKKAKEHFIVEQKEGEVIEKKKKNRRSKSKRTFKKKSMEIEPNEIDEIDIETAQATSSNAVKTQHINDKEKSHNTSQTVEKLQYTPKKSQDTPFTPQQVDHNLKKQGTPEVNISKSTGRNNGQKSSTVNTPKSADKKKGPGTLVVNTPRSANRSKEQGTPGIDRRHNQTPKTRNQQNGNEANSFPSHWKLDDMQEKLATGELLKGIIRINKKNYKDAYINHPNGGMDILIEGIRNRNRALEGDEVAVQILLEEDWKSQQHSQMKQQTGRVVGILKLEHSRQAVGTLKPLPEKDSIWALFSPRDSRVPRIRVIAEKCPPNFANMPEMLYVAEIKTWDDQRFALGSLVSIIGMSGSIETETASILMENGLEVTPYGPEMAQYYPKLPYTIPQEEIDKRDDFRKMCIFTIDPATARDLDDAVSYRALPNGESEIGVHIADVAHFLKENTPLDELVCSKATTTYLVQSVYHMLPYDLCKLCSLTPGEDKLSFSVLWRISEDGIIGEPRFTRSVMISCCQMSYEQAQAIMDTSKDKVWTETDVPKLHRGFTPQQVVDTVLALQPIARKLREGRFHGGALRIDQPKLNFSLDPTTGLPDKFSVYQNMECHRLIEELMLLANMAVAKQLHGHMPHLALLRCHPPPHDHMLPELQRMLSHVGVELDITHSGTMHTSLQKYLNSSDLEDAARGYALSSLISKPMARAKYFCANDTKEDEHWHYALSVPLYTHFTSPIRRYADIIVHRLLAVTLNYSPAPEWHPDFVSKIASNCNGKKYSAKRAGEQSSELYLTLYVGMHGPLQEQAIVVDVKDHSFDVLVLSTGSTHRIYTNNLDKKIASAKHTVIARNVMEATVTWHVAGITQVIKLFSLVTIQLRKAENELRLIASLYPPPPSAATKL